MAALAKVAEHWEQDVTDEDKALVDFFLNAEPEKITITDEQYQRLLRILESDPGSNEKLQELLTRMAPWE